MRFTGLANGNHTFLLRAIDPAGKRGIAARYAWRVVNAAPVALTQIVTTSDETPVAIKLAATDDDDVNFHIVTRPAHGSLQGTPPNLTYIPESDFFGIDEFSFSANDGQTDSAPATVKITVQRGVYRFAALGLYGVSIGQQAVITDGDVGASLRAIEDVPDGISPASRSDGDFVEVRINQQAKLLNANNFVLGDTVDIRQTASVFNVGYNRLLNQGTVQGDKRNPLDLSLLPGLPALPTITPGTRDVVVGQRSSLTLDPGSYGVVLVGQQGTLLLKPGLYHFKSVSVGQQAKLLLQGATELRVLGRFAADQQSYVGPAPEATGSSAKQIRIFVAASSTSRDLSVAEDANAAMLNASTVSTDTVAEESKVAEGLVPEQANDGEGGAVSLGQNSRIIANIVSPNGSIRLRQGGSVTGALLGKWVSVGQQAELTLSSGFEPARGAAVGSADVGAYPAPSGEVSSYDSVSKVHLSTSLYLPLIAR